ncbi:STAS domain-containing protein [Paractinoplanes maris]|uniref:STAS domain-containing protein n=1 Tax=Paractinoplanes maris TaxID=1734446 RepID=UPI002021DFC2|nr:STAS domain-containing protein [Actinoplanes maris]
MAGPFEARKYDEGSGVVRIAVRGEIDHDVGAALAVIIRNAADQDGLCALVVDLERVSFIAAAGVRSLLDGRQATLVRGCSYLVVNAAGIVQEVLAVAGVLDLLCGSGGARLAGPSVTLDTPWWARQG